MFNKLAALAEQRARRVVIVAVIGSIAAAAFGGGVADRLDPYGADDPATESVRTDGRLEAAGYRSPGIVVLVEDAPVDQAATKRRIAKLNGELASRPDVASVASFYTTASDAFVSADRDATYLLVALKSTDDKDRQDSAKEIIDELSGQPGVSVGGGLVAETQVNEQVEKDLQRAELLAFPLLFALAFVFFRSLVAAALPLLVGGLAIVGTLAILRAASEVGSISVFALNLTTGLGLGLAIDYSLFIVSRYREEIAKTGPGAGAMRRTMATAGRTVMFSSLTVAAALASLTLLPQRFLYSMGIGGALVALFAALVSLTVLPAVLSLLGDRVSSLSPAFLQRRATRDATAEASGFWYRLSRFVMARPLPIAAASATLLIALGIPFTSIEFTSPDAQILPPHHSARAVDDVIRAEFPPFHDNPIEVAVSGDGERAVAVVASQIAAIDGVGSVNPPQPLSSGVTLITAFSANPAIAEASRQTVREIRAIEPPAGSEVGVSGQTAHFLDFQSSLGNHLPRSAAFVIVSTLIILFLMTGSVVLPVKALVMNALNLSAVFGILVLIFQDGRLEGLLDYTSQGAIEQTMPILLFAVAFGLSTDYAVFLLGRIKEARDGGATNDEAVAIGLERTGRIVSAAALLFAIAIGAFATSEIVFIKENGVGTALAVLIDASIIRALLVPSLMELLGSRNWWAPGPLRRLHDRFGLSE